MHTIGTIREFNTEHFRVVVEAEEELDLDLSWDETGKTAEQLDAGDLIAFCAHAYVEYKPTGAVLANDYLGNCIYRSLEEFADHRECARSNRRRIRRYGRYQIYRKNRPYDNILRESDKARRRGFATREKAEVWAKANLSEPYEIHETGKCGSYFAGMVSEVIREARQEIERLKTVYVRQSQK